jgi:hypothetical protein
LLSAIVLISLVATAGLWQLTPRQKVNGAKNQEIKHQASATIIPAPKKMEQVTQKESGGVKEELILKLPKGVENVTPRPVIEITYLKVPAHQYLWLRVYGVDKDSNKHLYWPIGHIMGGRAHSIIHDIHYEEVTPRTWSSAGLEGNDPWFMDPGKMYQLELLALNAADDEFLRSVYQHEWDTGTFDGVNEDEHIHDLHPQSFVKRIVLTRGSGK